MNKLVAAILFMAAAVAHGTTWTVKESGGDYTTLVAALSNGSTVANDTIEIQGPWESANITVCIVADNNITIIATGLARHTGVWDETTAYRLVTATNGSHSILVNNTGCVIDGLQVMQNSSGTSDECTRMAASGGTLTVQNSLYRGKIALADADGIYTSGINCTVNVDNCIFFDFGRAAFHLQSYLTSTITQTWNFNSVTAYGCGSESASTDDGGGFCIEQASSSTANLNFVNCVFLHNEGTGDADYNLGASHAGGTINWDIDYCADSDNSITGLHSGTGNLASQDYLDQFDTPAGGDDIIFEDLTAAPYDLRLYSNASNNAQDAHDGSSGWETPLATDIVGTSRPQNTTYDMGAFEIAAAGAGMKRAKIFSSLAEGRGGLVQ